MYNVLFQLHITFKCYHQCCTEDHIKIENLVKLLNMYRPIYYQYIYTFDYFITFQSHLSLLLGPRIGLDPERDDFSVAITNMLVNEVKSLADPTRTPMNPTRTPMDPTRSPMDPTRTPWTQQELGGELVQW